jgi:CheY-like chemotaxis protein
MVQHVILADDDEDDCFLFTTAIKEVGKKVKLTCINSCTDLLDYLKKNEHPDMIFLDLNMPGMHGLECLAEMKAAKQTEETDVVIYSTSGNAELIKEAYAKGAKSYIVKPHSIPELKKILIELWDGRAC